MSDNVTIVVDLEKGSIDKPFKEIEAQADKSGKKAGKSLESGIGSGLKSVLKLTGAVTAAFAGVATFLGAREAIKNAQIQEDAVNRLNASLISTGKFSEKASKDLQEYASSLQQVTKFGDEAILESIALTQTLANLDTNGLKKATQASLDLASALKIDLETASRLVAKAANGQTEAFNRYGIAIQKGRNEAETFANTLQAIEQRFGGRARAEINTYSGALAQLKNNFGDLLEEVGNYIVKNPFVIEGIKQISKFTAESTRQLAEFFKTFNTFNDVILPLLKFNESIVKFVVVPLEFLVNLTQKTLLGITLSINGFIDNLGLVASKVAAALDFAGIQKDVSNKLSQFGQITTEALRVAKQDYQAVDLFNFGVSDKLLAQNEQLRLGLEQFNATLNQGTEGSREIINQNIGNSFSDATAILRKEAEKARAELEKFQADVNRVFNQGIARTISGGIQNIAKSLVEGKNLFADFGSFLLGAFGDLAIQLGEFYVATGLANLALLAVNPGAQIATGAALIALGSILKSFTSGGVGKGSGAGALATGGTTSGFDQTDLADVPRDLQRDEKDKQVQVVIQGNVFDSEETGTSIAKILSDAFGKQGVKLAGSGLA